MAVTKNHDSLEAAIADLLHGSPQYAFNQHTFQLDTI